MRTMDPHANYHLIDGSRISAGLNSFLADNYEQGHEVGSSLVDDSRAWARSRRKFKEKERRTDSTVLYGHDPDQFDRLRDAL